MSELNEILYGLKHFFEHLFQAMQNIFFWIVALLAYLIGYPAQKAILTFVLALFILDIVSKFNTLRVQNKGLYKAFMNGKISSRSFWDGFITKIIGYFIILVIANLASITPQINYVGELISYVLYVGLAFYEVISNLENLRDANFLAVIPILNRLKKEQDKFLESEITNTSNSSVEDAENNNSVG